MVLLNQGGPCSNFSYFGPRSEVDLPRLENPPLPCTKRSELKSRSPHSGAGRRQRQPSSSEVGKKRSNFQGLLRFAVQTTGLSCLRTIVCT
jgi:hypothetical protein